MKPRLWAVSFLGAAGFAAACSAAPPSDVAPPPSPTPGGGGAAVGTGDPPPPAGSSTPPAPSGAVDAAGGACPTGMVLVEGEYCTEVEHKCLKEWYAAANKKRICEKFEPTAKCVGQRVKKRYCIDQYAWPNQKGVRPEVMNRFYQAQIKCAAIGKRMCSESEWTFACEGPEMKPFPYGFDRDARKCNGDREWDFPNMDLVAKRDPKELARLWQGVPSGSQPACVSDFGVYDLPGNTDEVVASEQSAGGWKGKFDSVNTGGPWYLGVRNQCRPKIYTHAEDFYYYFLGFRCCAEPDGKPTEPRTERQQRAGHDLAWVEKRAQFTVAEMKEKLDLKSKGACECKPTDIRCKTMCGTLLGPDAKDADMNAPIPPR